MCEKRIKKMWKQMNLLILILLCHRIDAEIVQALSGVKTVYRLNNYATCQVDCLDNSSLSDNNYCFRNTPFSRDFAFIFFRFQGQ